MKLPAFYWIGKLFKALGPTGSKFFLMCLGVYCASLFFDSRGLLVFDSFAKVFGPPK